MAKKGLGKGLGALLAEADTGVEKAPAKKVSTKEKTASVKDSSSQDFYVDIELLKPNPHQPRTEFDEEALQELSDSIKEHGLIQAVLVEEVGDGTYYIIAGERRTRASKLAGLKQLPVRVQKFSEQKKLEVALIENIQRENLNAIEEARAYHNLMKLANITQDEVAKRVGKNRSTVANALRLLKLPDDMQKALLDGSLSAGHARAVLSVINPSDQRILFARIIGAGLSVRDSENQASEMNAGKKELKTKKKAAKVSKVDADYAFLENQLIEALSTKVSLNGNFDKGSIVIEYFSRDDLDRIYERLMDT